MCDSGEGVASEKGGGGDEATQAYELNASLESMEVDPTVAYGNTVQCMYSTCKICHMCVLQIYMSQEMKVTKKEKKMMMLTV